MAILRILSGFVWSNMSGHISTTCLGGSGTSIFNDSGGKPCKASPSLTQLLYLSAQSTRWSWEMGREIRRAYSVLVVLGAARSS